jgi:hypothetical protein
MGIPTLPEVPMKPTTEQLAQIVAEGFQQLGYLMSGFLSSDNAREFGGWIVNKTKLETKHGVYPRIEFDSKNLAILAAQTEGNYMRISPDAFGSTPGVVLSNSAASALLYLLGSSLSILTAAGNAEIQISSGKNLDLFCNATSGYKTRFDSWEAMLNVVSNRTLQEELDTLTSQGNTNMIDINSLFAYCGMLDARITALGG